MTIAASIDPDLLPICPELSKAFATFERESAELRADVFKPWIDTEAYAGAWLVCPLIIQHGAVPPIYDVERNRDLCPESARLLARDSRILLASFSRLSPQCKIRTHIDYPKAGVLRIQLGIRGQAGAALVFDDGEVSLEPGELFVFDQSMPHSAYNNGSCPRDVLIVDYELSAIDTAAVVATRDAVNLGPTAEFRPAP